MILKGNTHGDGAALARYMLTGKDGETAEFVQARGLDFFSSDPAAAFGIMQRMAEATTKSTMPFFHGQIRAAPDDKPLTAAQVLETADRMEKRLGFTGHPRMITAHTDLATGEKNFHVAWFRMDVERNCVIDPGLFKVKLNEEARFIEKDFGLRIVSSRRQPHDRARAAKRTEFEQSRRLDTDDRKIRTAILDGFEKSDGGKAFAAAMKAHGYELANGDRRNCFVVIDQAGGFHALNKALTGKTLAEIGARLADLDRSTLRNATEVSRERQPQRQTAREAQEGQQYAGAADMRGKANTASDGHARGPQPEKKPLGKTAGEIRLAWSLTRSGQQFAQEIDTRGLALVYVSRERADASHRSHAFARTVNRQSRELREGFGVVDPRGNVTRIDQRVTGDLWEEIQKRLGGIDKDALLTVDQARDLMRHRNREAFREQKKAERDQARPASFIERKITDCENRARAAGAIIQRDGSGAAITGADALADRLKPKDERQTEAATIHGAAAFAARLDQAGIAIVRVTAADMKALDGLRQAEEFSRVAGETNREARPSHNFAKVQVGDIAAVTRRGDVFTLNPHKLDLAQIERTLIDAAKSNSSSGTSSRLMSVIEARAAFEINRDQTGQLWALRKAEGVARHQAFEARRDLRGDVASAERAVHTAFETPAAATGKAIRNTGKLARLAERIFETAFGLLFGAFMAAPKDTRAQAEQKTKAATNEETLHARAYDAAQQQKEAAVDWMQFEQNRAQQYDDLIHGRLGQSTPATPKEIQRGDDRERERER